MKSIIDNLAKPFNANQIKWKVQAAKGKWSTFVAYVDARAVVERLNEATKGMWQDKYRDVSGLLICSIGIFDTANSQWLWREDTGVESTEQKEKGHVSDAFKRASVKWGLGHDLYSSMPIIKVANNATDWKGNPCAAGFDGKPIFDATLFCKELIGKNPNVSVIWFNSQKSPTTPAKSPAPTSNKGKDINKRITKALADAGIGTEKQQVLIGNLLSSSKFNDIQAGTVKALKAGTKTPSQVIDYLQENTSI